jgi:hypothetical protein
MPAAATTLDDDDPDFAAAARLVDIMHAGEASMLYDVYDWNAAVILGMYSILVGFFFRCSLL